MTDTEIWMCYGCCCGVPQVDVRHRPRREPLDRIRSALQAKLANGGTADMPIRKTGCLGPCSKGNMVVVHKRGMDAMVFQGINSSKMGEEVADYAMDVERRGWGAGISDKLDKQLYGSIPNDDVPPPPAPEPYRDRHP